MKNTGLTGSFGMIVLGATLAMACAAPAQPSQPEQAPAGGGQGEWRGGGTGGMMGGARGLMGTVTEVGADHYTVKNDAGDVYTVFFSANTRIMRQPAGRRGAGEAGGRGSGQARTRGEDGERPMPEMLKATDIKVGDAIMAGGEVDAAKKTVGAMMILQMDPERAKQARAMEAQFGKTWLAGKITAIDGTKITVEGALDHVPHTFDVDENTSFRKRRESITMADIKVGDQLRLEGAVKDGVFVAATVNAMEFQPREQGRERGGPAPQ